MAPTAASPELARTTARCTARQPQDCTVCGKRLSYIPGFRGLGLRERRHARKCMARAGVMMATDAMDSPVDTESKTVEVESTQLLSTVAVHNSAEVRQEEASERPEKSSLETKPVDTQSVVPFAQYYSANFRSASPSAWKQLHSQFPEASKPIALEPTEDITKVEEAIDGEEIEEIAEIKETFDGDEIKEFVTNIENFISETEDPSNGSNAVATAAKEQHCLSVLPLSLAAMFDAALASGEFVDVVDRVVTEQGYLNFSYTWQQHNNTSLPAHLEDERKRLGVDEEDWLIRLNATDSEGFFLDLDGALHEDQFPVAITWDARGNWWYSRKASGA